jgi:hypothetical protein
MDGNCIRVTRSATCGALKDRQQSLLLRPPSQHCHRLRVLVGLSRAVQVQCLVSPTVPRRMLRSIFTTFTRSPSSASARPDLQMAMAYLPRAFAPCAQTPKHPFPLWHDFWTFCPSFHRAPIPSPSSLFNTLPAYQPHRSHQSASRVPVAASLTFPNFPSHTPPLVFLLKWRHRNDNTEDVPPPKRIRMSHRPCPYNAHVPPSHSTVELNHRLHSD